MATLAERVAALSSAQRVRLLRTMSEAGEALGPVLGIVPARAGDGPAPLSPAQEDLWMFEALYPDSAAINLCSAYHFDRPVDPEGLETALSWVVANHDILRGTVAGGEGDLRMEFAPESRIPFERIDLREAENPGPAAYDAAVWEFRRRTFDLAKEPLIRGVFITVDDDRRVLILGLHHIITDWWSFDVLHTEFSKAYRAFLDGVPYPTPRPRIQYADYAAWQRELEAAGVFERQLGFWRDYLADLPSAPPLGAQRRLVESEFSAGQVEFRLDDELMRRARAFAKEHDATLFHVLMAAFAVFASRLSGADDFVVGTPVANRSAQGLDDVIGYVMNMVAIRWRLRPGRAFDDLVAGFAKDFAAIMANADVPIGRVIADLNPERELGRSPLIRWIFMYLPGQESIFHLPESARHERLSTGAEENDFSLVLRNMRGETHLTCEFRADLFDTNLVRAWLEAYQVLMDALLADGTKPIGAAPMTAGTAAIESSQADNPHDGVQDAAASIAAWAQASPDAAAVADGSRELTYAELDQQAESLAAALRARGVGRESVVAICLPRTVDFPVAALGVLKAGAAFLPLDAAYPAERLRRLLADSGAAVVVVSEETEASAAGLETPTLSVTQPTATNSDRAHSQPSPQDLAYVIYTSGSTGAPKGVAVTRASLANLAHAQAESFSLTPGDRALQFASHSFDVSLEEVFGTLVAGACLVIGQGPSRTSVADLLRTIESKRISVLNLPTAYWHELVRALAAQQQGSLPACVRLVVIGGEAADAGLIEAWFAASPEARLINAYGPTETTVTCLGHEPAADDTEGASAIGLPIRGLHAYLLDELLRPVPAGVVAELYVGGAGVARGYLGRSALTAESFVADPFAAEPGARMYRTGDRCYRDVHGVVHFVGRVDDQVKIRGFRIEPGEAEAALLDCPDVAAGAVVVRADRQQAPRLVGYYVPAPGATPDAAAVRAQIAERLPHYLVPSAFVELEALPLTSSGKIDRAALPEPAAVETAQARPMTEREQAVAALFDEVLGITGSGPDTDFFAQGGHSLLATRLAARVRAVLGAELGIRTVFEVRTVAGVAAGLGRPARTRPALTRRTGAGR